MALDKKTYNCKLWFDKKDEKFTRFLTFLICPIPGIKNFETLQGFRTFQI